MLPLCSWCSIAFSHFAFVCVQALLRILRSNSHETGEAQPQISRRTEVATSNDHFGRQKSCFSSESLPWTGSVRGWRRRREAAAAEEEERRVTRVGLHVTHVDASEGVAGHAIIAVCTINCYFRSWQ
jgi:hypothetical protein